jgi:peptidoglycan-associated lipoprotein
LIVKEAQTEEAHQINRRTEFKVLKYNPDQMSEEEKDKDPLDEYERFFDKEEGK